MMASIGAAIPEIKKADNPSAAHPGAPGTAQANVATTSPNLQTAFKIVRVRKPDGTIVRVRRPIPAGRGDEPISKGPAVVSVKSANPSNASTTAISKKITATTPTSNTSNVVHDEKATKNSDLAKHQAEKPMAKASTGEPSKVSAKAATSDSAEKAAPRFSLYRGLRRFSQAVNLTTVFDLDGDLGFDGDIQPEDEELDDDDDNADDDDFDDDDQDDENHTDPDDTDRDISQDDTANSEGLSEKGGADDFKSASGGAQLPVQSRPNYSAAAKTIADTTKPKQSDFRVREREFPAPTADATEKMDKRETGPNSNSAILKPAKRYGQILGTFSWFNRIVIWTIMIVCPGLYIGLGVATALNEGQDYDSPQGIALQEAIKVGVTTWPIVFAALVAQSLKTLATYRVERGIRLMTLEQLISSHSVGGAIRQPFLLRNFNLVSLGLLCLWGLSPLASQAMQRMAYPVQGFEPDSVNILYVNTTVSKNPFWNQDQDYGLFNLDQDSSNFGLNDVYNLYDSIFLATPPGYNQSTDLWNYPRIPLLEQSAMSQYSEEWYSMAENETYNTIFYVSPFGIPFGIPNNDTNNLGDYSFEVVSSYLLFNCSSRGVATLEEIKGTLSLSRNIEDTLYMRMDSVSNGDAGDKLYNLTFASRITEPVDNTWPYLDSFANFFCNFQQKFVRSHIKCWLADTGVNICAVDKMKPLSSNFTTSLTDFSETFVNAGQLSALNGSRTLTERYIQDGSIMTGQDGRAMNLSTVDIADFTRRFSYLLNGYFQLGFTQQYQDNFTASADYNNVPIANCTGEYTDIGTPVFEVSRLWISILLICSVFLLVANITSAILEMHTIGPDILGFASSIVRRSRYVKIPKGDETTSTMSGGQSAYRLRDVVVMMQDVDPDAPVGRIALGNLTKEDKRKLKRGKPYR